MDTYDVKVVSVNGTVIMITREVKNLRDAIDMAFEEACSEPKTIDSVGLDRIRS